MNLRPPASAFLVALLALTACQDDPIQPPGTLPPPEDRHAFRYTPPAQAPAVDSIAVRGTFNAWGSTPMRLESDGSWQADVALDDGTHEYKFFINGQWPTNMCYDETWGHPSSDYRIDADAHGCMGDGHGGQNAVVLVGDAPGLLFDHAAGEARDVSMADGKLSVRFRVRAGQVREASVVTGDQSFPMHIQFAAGLQEVWRAAVPGATSTYELLLESDAGSESFGPYTVPAEPFTAVPWVGEAVGYQIFPERFWNGDPDNDHWTLETDVVHYMHPDTWNVEPVLMDDWSGPIGESHCCHQYFGGDLQGVLDRLDHLTALGVTLIYMNPIFTAGSAHGYDTFDYLEVAPNFGDETLLRTLLDAAESRGMRIMWDFVPNHVGVGHWAFQHAVTVGDTSPYWDWFNFHVPHSEIQVGNGNHYDAWWGLGTLPRLETRNPEVFDSLMAVTRYWTEFGLDGIRVDVPGEIRNRSEFFPAFRQAAKSVNPDVYLVGEIWQRDPSWVEGDQFDALMNYAMGEGVVERFARGHMTGSATSYEMAQLYTAYPEASTAMQFNLISSHDTGRLLTKLGGGGIGETPTADALARQRLASAMLYALPGVPVTFQGDECAFLGASGGDDEHRYPFQWQSCDAAMLAHYQELATLRSQLPALESPVIRAHQGSGPLLSFYRGEPGTREVLAVFNNGGSTRSVTLPAGEWTDAVTGEAVSGSAAVGPIGWRYLRRG